MRQTGSRQRHWLHLSHSQQSLALDLFSTPIPFSCMGKSIQATGKIARLARIIASAEHRQRSAAQLKPSPKAAKPISFRDPIGFGTGCRQRVNAQGMEEAAESSGIRQRMPLAEVVADCVRRWFQDALKEAKNGDTSMQVLVGQMYYSGYGIPRDAQKGRAWISKASRSRSSVWKLGVKRPGYNASDSDSDDQKVDAQ